MGDILRAYTHLNTTFGLKLKPEQLFAAEMQFKLDFGKNVRMPAELLRNPEALMADWELVSTLVPRRTKISAAARATMKRKTDALKGK